MDLENVGGCNCAKQEKPAYKFGANIRILHKAASQRNVQVEGCAAKTDAMQEGDR